jgi:flagellar motor switch protein FliM
MSGDDEPSHPEAARKLRGAMLEHPGVAFERMPGLAMTLERFIAEAPVQLASLVPATDRSGSIETAQTTTLSRAIGDCIGLTAAIYAGGEPETRIVIALDERIVDLVVASAFGEEALETEAEIDEEAPQTQTAIETALVEAFARALAPALETAFAPLAPLGLTFERLLTLNDASALGRRDQPAAATRFSLPVADATCECLLLIPQALLLPFRKELEQAQADEAAAADYRWLRSMETGVKQTRLPVSAVIGETPMTLGEVAGLRVGALLTLQSGDLDSVRLECSGRTMFRCRLGQDDGRYRLEIEGPAGQAPEAGLF